MDTFGFVAGIVGVSLTIGGLILAVKYNRDTSKALKEIRTEASKIGATSVHLAEDVKRLGASVDVVSNVYQLMQVALASSNPRAFVMSCLRDRGRVSFGDVVEAGAVHTFGRTELQAAVELLSKGGWVIFGGALSPATVIYPAPDPPSL